ncbi:hypothetical protein FCM35_KLT10157 [Carex littledalei]|uniref:Uncharacterized protein n=1 Tax=Carex littledalei TaxID=544730 RepID=A0A833RJY5_9POAL|nr:hypothetical protein FCM35_KLT10157 [Carex littledalei]
MELSDLATRLPPRKRLLAGLKNPNPNIHLELPAQLTSTETGFRIREIINSHNLSPEEAIRSLKSIALAASEAAAAARIVAMEKAAVAEKAKENAKKALQLLDSLSSGKKNERKVRGRPKLKKKQVSMEVLCNAEELANRSRVRKKVTQLTSSESRVRVRDSDEEVAKKLHRAMNSSPRISTCKEKVVVCAKADFDEGGNEKCPMERPRVKRKRLFLNRVDEREAKRLKPKTSFVDCREKIENQNSSKDGSNSNKLTSVWRCIKFKTSKCASDTKILHRTGTKASAIVEAE